MRPNFLLQYSSYHEVHGLFPLQYSRYFILIDGGFSMIEHELSEFTEGSALYCMYYSGGDTAFVLEGQVHIIILAKCLIHLQIWRETKY